MIKKTIVTSILWFCILYSIKAQTGVQTSSPDASSILELKSVNKGVLLPRLIIPNTNDKAPITTTTIADGLLGFNISPTVNAVTANPTLYFWSAAAVAWQKHLYFKETPKVAVFGITADRTVLDNMGRGNEEPLTAGGTIYKMINSGYLPGLSFVTYGSEETIVVGSGTYVLEISYLITAPIANPASRATILQNDYYSMGYFSDLFIQTYNSNTGTFTSTPINYDSRVEGGVLSKTNEPHRIRFLHTFDLPNTAASYALQLYIGRRDGSTFNDLVTVLANGTIMKLTKLR